MKKLLFFLLPFISLVAGAQGVKISALPTHSGNAESSTAVIVIGGVTKQTLAKNLSLSKLDSAKIRNDSLFFYNTSGTETFGGKVNGGVTAFNTRTGSITPQSGDYSSFYVPLARQVNGHALSSDVTVTKSDVGLGSVPNVDATVASNITQDATHRICDGCRENKLEYCIRLG
jgi:hypothetical protein